MNVQTRLDSAEQQSDYAGTEGFQAPSSTQISLIEIWQIARLRARVIFGAAAAILILVALVDLSLTPLYKGTAIVMLDDRQDKVVNVQEVLSGLPTDQASILNQIQILQSRELAWRVVQKLDLDKDEEFNTSLHQSWTSYIAFLNPLSWIPMGGPPLTEQEKKEKIKDAIITKFETRLNVQQLQAMVHGAADRFRIRSSGQVRAHHQCDRGRLCRRSAQRQIRSHAESHTVARLASRRTGRTGPQGAGRCRAV